MKPATQPGGRSGGEHGSYGNWRRECTRIRTVAGLLLWMSRIISPEILPREVATQAMIPQSLVSRPP